MAKAFPRSSLEGPAGRYARRYLAVREDSLSELPRAARDLQALVLGAIGNGSQEAWLATSSGASDTPSPGVLIGSQLGDLSAPGEGVLLLASLQGASFSFSPYLLTSVSVYSVSL